MELRQHIGATLVLVACLSHRKGHMVEMELEVVVQGIVIMSVATI